MTLIVCMTLIQQSRVSEPPLRSVSFDTIVFQELEVISHVRDVLQTTIKNSQDQLQALREAKHRLEMDWSDKVSAHKLDSKNTSLKSSGGNVMHRPGQAVYKEL